MLYGKPTRGTSLSTISFYIQKETYGEIRNKTLVHFTVCGNEKVNLVDVKAIFSKKYILGAYIEDFLYEDLIQYFKSDDERCPPYKFEILSSSGGKSHPMFEVEDKKEMIKFNKANVGIYQALIHPLTHSFADSLPVLIEIFKLDIK